MTRSIIIPAIFLLALCLSIPGSAEAQTVYVGPAYSTHVEDPGIAAGLYIPIAGLIQAGGDFTYYFVSDEGAVSFTIWTLDLNGRYPLVAGANGGPSVYALAGINILRWSGDYGDTGGFNFDTSATDVGLNAGAVVEFVLSSFGVFAKGHAVIGGDSNGFVFGGGLFKTFGG